MNTRITLCPHCRTKNRVPAVATGFPRCAQCKERLPWVADATDSDFDAAVNTSALVLVDLWASWCGPCLRVAPILEQLAATYAGRLKVVKVDVDANRGMATRYQAQSIPLMLLMSQGAVVDRILGAQPQAKLTRIVERHLT
ncbi:MAG: thioredoxin [Propioniciclava sp.]